MGEFPGLMVNARVVANYEKAGKTSKIINQKIILIQHVPFYIIAIPPNPPYIQTRGFGLIWS